jgi:predicted nucleic acid-binding protein
MSVDEFADSNVFVYANSMDDARKREVARQLVERLNSEGGTISYQVVQETINVLSRGEQPMRREDVLLLIDDVLVPLWTVLPSPALYERALGIKERYGFGFYDSLIVAAALAAGCTRLYSEDLHDGQQIEGLTIVNPFAA